MKKLLRILLTFLVIIVIAYFVFLNLPKASIKNKPAEFQLTAESLYSDFESNEKKSNRLYIGKTIQVKGIIGTVEQDGQGATVIFLESENDFGGVLCTLVNGEESKLDKFKSGSEITIKGLCTGMLMDVVLNKCIII